MRISQQQCQTNRGDITRIVGTASSGGNGGYTRMFVGTVKHVTITIYEFNNFSMIVCSKRH
jgi:hypothetical protein